MQERLRNIFCAGLAMLARAGCGGEDTSVEPTANAVTVPPPATSPAPTPPPPAPTPANSPPTISGTPAGSVQAGSAYSFTPTASDAEGNSLTFSLAGAPSWASFNTGTGALNGTPTAAQIGSYGNIVISVSDGTSSRSLPAFSINVTSAGTGMGTATLRWSAPTNNTDGTPITNLSGYRIYHGTSANALNDVRPITSPGITMFVFDTLASGTHYFAISAVNALGVESPRSSALSKTVP